MAEIVETYHPMTESRVLLEIFVEICSGNMFTSFVDVTLLPAKLAGYTDKQEIGIVHVQ